MKRRFVLVIASAAMAAGVGVAAAAEAGSMTPDRGYFYEEGQIRGQLPLEATTPADTRRALVPDVEAVREADDLLPQYRRIGPSEGLFYEEGGYTSQQVR